MAVNFFSSKDSEEIRTMHSKSDNIEVLNGKETDEIIEYLLSSILQRYQKGLEESMKGSEFVFDSVDSLYYKLHKVNQKNNENKCFQYALTVTLNHEKIGKDPQRITKIKPFIDQYS